MHYIIGTSFTVDHRTVVPGQQKITSASIKNLQPRSKYELLFDPGHIYQLQRITKDDDDMFAYHFNRSDMTQHVIKFPSTRDADAVIAKFRKEQLPDYEAIYKHRAD
jgi:hypothetical protein